MNTLHITFLVCTVVILVLIIAAVLIRRKKRLKLSSDETPDDKGGKASKKDWWTENKDIVYSLSLVTIAMVFINVLCAKIGFLWWGNVYRHEAFGWLNISLLLAVFLTMVAKKPVVKYFAGGLAIIITVGVWIIGHPTENHEPIVAGYTIKSGEVSKVIAYEDIVSRDMVPVEVRFNKPDSLTEFGEWQKVEGGIQFPYPVTYIQYRALADTFTVRVKSPRIGS